MVATRFLKSMLALCLSLGTAGYVAAEVTSRQWREPEVEAAKPRLPDQKLAGKIAGEPISPYDQPLAAARFQAWQRSKDEHFDTGTAWLQAKSEADALPVFSSTRNEVIAARSPVPDAALDSWTALGPGNVGGRTRTLVFHANFSSNNTIFVGGVAGGIWRTTDAGATWTALGDFNPNIAVTALVIDRTDSNRMWAGTGEGFFNVDGVRGAGLFVSTDAGTTWTQLQSTAPSASNINFRFIIDLVQSPNVATTLYATTLTGLWRTTDSGATWTQFIDSTATSGTAANGCHDIITRPDVSPNDTVIVSCGNFAPTGTNTGIWRSVDANVAAPTWSKRLGPAGATTLNRMGRTSLAVAPSNSATIYALIACSAQAATGANACGDLTGTANDNHFDDGLRAVYRSTDGGATWTAQFTNTFSEANTANRELLLSNPLIGRCSLCTAICGVGATSSYGGQGWYDNVIAVDPANANRVWVGGIDLWRSDDAGVNWGVASYWGQQYMPTVPLSSYAHADQHGIWFPPNYNGTTVKTLYVSNDGGIQRTADATVAVGTSSTTNQATNSLCGQANRPAIVWNSLNNGYQVTQFYHGAVFPNGQSYFGGTQDNGTNLRAEATMGLNQWDEVNGGDGGYVAVDPTNTNILYAETTGISIVKSTNGGASFADATSGITDTGGLFINPFLLDPNLNTRLFTSGRSMWRSINSAGTWTQASSALATRTCGASVFNDNYSAYAVAPGDSTLMVMGTDLGRLCRLTNATASTSATAPACSTPFGATTCATISAIAFDSSQANSTAQNSRIVYATVSDFGFSHVLKSTDGGQTWVAIDNQAGTTARLPDVPAHTIVTDSAYPVGQRLYVGTDLGVFVTIDSGLNWMRENASFANTPVEWLVMHNRQVGTRSADTGASVSKAPATGELFAFTHGRSVFKTRLRAAGGFCSSPAAAIPDNNIGGVSSTITLNNISGAQTGWIDLDLQMTVTHANIGDLSATLTRTTGPGAPVSVTLFDRPGVPVTSFCTGSGDNVAATFDDDADFTAETRCLDATAPSLSGQFRPNGFMSTVMTPGTATYRLTVVDNNAGTSGSLASWCLVPTANTDATVPVTLGHLASSRTNSGVSIRFETGASVSIAGFELSASKNGDDVFARIAAEPDAVTAQSYRVAAEYSGSSFWLRVLNVDGSVDLKGPFTVGMSRGEPVPVATAIDWAPVSAEMEAAHADAVRVSDGRGAGTVPAVNLQVRRDGIQSLGFDELQSAGATGFADVPVAELAVSLRGAAVPMRVLSDDTSFNSGDRIEFIGQAIHRPSEEGTGFESLYTEVQPYRLSRDPALAARIPDVRTSMFAAPAMTRVQQDITLEDNRIYAYGSPLRDPWAWSRTLAFSGAPSESSESFLLPDPDATQPARIEVTLYGGNDFPTGGADHEAVVLLNGQVIGTAVFDGLSAFVVSANLVPGQFSASNTLTVRLPATNGQVYDMVYLEDIRISYSRGLNAADGALAFVAGEGTGQPISVAVGSVFSDNFEAVTESCSESTCRSFELTGLDAATTRVYQRAGTNWYAVPVEVAGSGVQLTIPVANGHRFEIADAQGVHSPGIAAVADTTGLQQGTAQYLVISHPQFASHLSGLLAQRQAEGLSTKLVTTDALYEAYSSGLIDPQAIEDYIGFAQANLGTQYVLLVGGDTYDYFDDLGLGSVSHVPTRYRAGDQFVRFAASDNEFADTNNDLIPDVALGRLPVRTVAELQSLIGKMQAFGQSPASGQIFSADQSGDGIDFDVFVNEHMQTMTGNAARTIAFMDVLGVSGAKTALIDGINGGARYVEYFGHSSPDRWSYAPLLTAGDLQNGVLTNVASPVFVNQLGCWNTFFVSPQANGMAHGWLNGTGGAAAVLGATALTEVGSGHAFGNRIAERLVPGVRIGDVLLQAKQDLVADGVPANDILILSTLLGDPAMRY